MTKTTKSKIKSIFLSLLIAAAPVTSFSQDATAATSGGELQSLLIQFGVIFVIFYFLLIRPQQKKMQQQVAMTNSLKKNDKIVTNSGFCAKVTKVTEGEKFIEVEIAEGVQIRILRSSVGENLTNIEAAAKAEKSAKAAKASDKK